MYLKIDLADEADVRAAVALLQTVLVAVDRLPDFTPPPPVDTTAQHVFGVPAVPAPAPAVPAPAPAVPAPAPAVPAPAVPAPVGAPELDSAGQPWDPEIHASTKTKVTDGTWKRKPQRGGAAPAVPAPAVPAPAVPAPTVPAPTVPAPTVPAPAVPAPAVPAPAAPAPAVPAPAAPAPVGAPTTFETMVPLITKAMAAGKIPTSALSEACAELGLPGVAAVQQNPACVPLVWGHLSAKFAGAL